MATNDKALPPSSVLTVVRTETDRMFERIAADARGVGRWIHYCDHCPGKFGDRHGRFGLVRGRRHVSER